MLALRIEGHRVLYSLEQSYNRDMEIVAFLLNIVCNFDFGQH